MPSTLPSSSSYPGADPRRLAGSQRRALTPTVAALGGGHGLAASLRALRLLTDRLTAIVTVADNGGSSGSIREQVDVLPPGDLRMALAALCDDSEWGLMWRDVIQHRFRVDGDLNGHALGNLMILSLWQLLDDPVEGLDWMGRLLGARGRVLPMALDPLNIEADTTGADGCTRLVSGQSQVAKTSDRVDAVRLVPSDPRVPAEVIGAVHDADWVILGPGSWYTSVVPHLLVPDLHTALAQTRGRICLTMNLSARDPETNGLNPADLLGIVRDVAPDMRIDTVLVDPATLAEHDDHGELSRACAGCGTQLITRPVAAREATRHDPLRLAAAYKDVFDTPPLSEGGAPRDEEDRPASWR